ncbi:MAG TPA: FAD binding domain-containing protein, partial [Actinophytocola sp.]|uniref:FAD binding domain-containing protein n=1 Tax=Actinophytocola sp. TaxID=1872138 RepID=UPI002F92202F
MDFFRPGSLSEALAVKAGTPEALPIAGGTDVMVELNFDKRRPAALLDLGGVAELREWSAENGHVRLGAAVPYTRIVTELADVLPGLAMASR